MGVGFISSTVHTGCIPAVLVPQHHLHHQCKSPSVIDRQLPIHPAFKISHNTLSSPSILLNAIHFFEMHKIQFFCLCGEEWGGYRMGGMAGIWPGDGGVDGWERWGE